MSGLLTRDVLSPREGGQLEGENLGASAPLAPLLLAIKETHRQRVDLLRAELRLNNQIEAITRRVTGLTTLERAAILKKAKRGQGQEGFLAHMVCALSADAADRSDHTSRDTHTPNVAPVLSFADDVPDQARTDIHWCNVGHADYTAGWGDHRSHDHHSSIVAPAPLFADDVQVQSGHADHTSSVLHPDDTSDHRKYDAQYGHVGGPAACGGVGTPNNAPQAEEVHPAAHLLAQLDQVALITLPLQRARTLLAESRKPLEKELERLAKQLPVWSAWAVNVRGLGPLSLAQIVGEVGDFAAYDNPAKVWKRMGLAVIDGARQRRVSDAEQALVHGYSPQRRSIMYVVATNFVKVPHSHYREYYDAEKARQYAKLGVPGPGHANNRAMRHVSKRLLKHIWQAWRGTISSDMRPGLAADNVSNIRDADPKQ